VNREERAKVLAESLNEATRRAEQERADKQQVERIAAAVKAKLAHRIHAADEVDLRCPQCGFTASEDQFDEVEEPDTDEESDGFSTDNETSETGGDDNVEELDAKGKSRVVAELLARKRRR
jgi:hypothetical protein